jgi:hypothetical protein
LSGGRVVIPDKRDDGGKVSIPEFDDIRGIYNNFCEGYD